MSKLYRSTLNRMRYFGFLAFAFLIWYVEPNNILQALAHTQFSYLLAAMVLNLPNIALKTWRWQVLLLEAGIRLPFAVALRAYAASIFIGCLTPGRLGEFVKAAYVLQNGRGELSRVLPSVFIDRLFDFYFLLVLGLIGLFRYSLSSNQSSHLKLALLAAVMFVLPGLFSTSRLGNWLKRSPAIGKLKTNWRGALLEIHGQLASLTSTSLARGFGLTVLAYTIFFFQCQIGASATGVEIPFMDLILVMSVTNLLSFLPVSISGIGIRDASLIIFLGRFGIGQAQAVAFSMAILVIFYVCGILLGSMCWVWEPMKIGTGNSVEVADSRDEK